MPIRVLLADDSGNVRKLLRSFLEEAEIDVCGEASNGLVALEEAERCKPDLVVLDLAMPKMNGAEVASILKKKMPGIKIILFTMYGTNIGKSLTAAIGFDAVLFKSEGMAQMVECIKSLVAVTSE
jgi:DNA-binding NarL/FixJ family response regulator